MSFYGIFGFFIFGPIQWYINVFNVGQGVCEFNKKDGYMYMVRNGDMIREVPLSDFQAVKFEWTNMAITGSRDLYLVTQAFLLLQPSLSVLSSVRGPRASPVHMGTPLDEQETLDLPPLHDDDVSPVGGGRLLGGNEDAQMREAAHAALLAATGPKDLLKQLPLKYRPPVSKLPLSLEDSHLERTQAFETRLSTLEAELRDLRRDAIEEEVRAWFARAECLPLLQDVHVNSVRPSDIPGQPPRPLWAKRNRSPAERARIRAIVTIKALITRFLGEADFEFDWRGTETGWWIPGPQVAQLIGTTLEDLSNLREGMVQLPDVLCVQELGTRDAQPQDVILIGADLNQDLHASVDEFPGMGLLRALISKHDLRYNRSVGHTWSARGVSSEIDFILLRAHRVQVVSFKRDDMKEALPSDHSPVFSVICTPRPLVNRAMRFPLTLLNSRIYVQVKAALLCKVRHERALAKADHKIKILEDARAGDRKAITYLRKSAAQRSFETSYIELRGGQQQAAHELQQFYEAKYSSFLPDSRGKLLQYFNRLLHEELAVPSNWAEAKVFGRLIMNRVAARCPPFASGRLGCRKGTQTVDGILAAQTVVGILRRKHGVEAHVAKLDIRAAFDSLAHSAVVRYLAECEPCPEAGLLWKLCSANRLHMSLGTHSWQVPVKQGIMQGSSYSADLFARVIDRHIRGLQPRWNAMFPAWEDGLCLPHFLLYADDILLFAMSAAELQRKLRDLTDSLQCIGLFINARKCQVLNIKGVTPGVWPRNSAVPLEGRVESDALRKLRFLPLVVV
ncbi:pol [Symbiodinium sp. CCMP2456]|nr:pol [Symbiodinium sp. CCMP2456]